MWKLGGVLLVCAVLVAIPEAASADSFTVDNVTVNYTDDTTNKGGIPYSGNNDVFGITSSDQIDAYFGTYLTIDTGIATGIKVEYIGKEAGWTNTLTVNGGSLAFSTATATLGNTYSWTQAADGRIDFQLTTNKGTASTGDDMTVNNLTSGNNPNDKNAAATGINFAVVHLTSDWTIDNTSPFDGSNKILSVLAHGTVLKAGLYIVLDDGGAGPDDNHDDLVFRISATPVPEPGTLLLMGLGVAAVGAGARRRRSRARR